MSSLLCKCAGVIVEYIVERNLFHTMSTGMFRRHFDDKNLFHSLRRGFLVNFIVRTKCQLYTFYTLMCYMC